jgi:uncharacterized cupredoxin-like copper-binding protein
MKFRWLGTIGLASVLALTACGGGDSEGGSGSGGEGGSGGGEATMLEVEGTNDLKFQPATLQTAAGQEFTVQLNNPSSVAHNWVLVQPGQEQAVASAAGGDGDVDEDTEGVIAAGDVVQGGGEEDVRVDALEAGEYTYICTVPGHYAAGMQGTLTVE